MDLDPDKAAQGRRRGRHFDHGGLRLVLLHLMAQQPRHGYELIKAIEERTGGAYSPSPGVIYPTLTLLEELGHAAVAATEGTRRLYAATAAGRKVLAARQPALEAMLARLGPDGPPARPPQILRAIENLRTAMRLRLARGPLTPEQADAIADLLDNAAKTLDRI